MIVIKRPKPVQPAQEPQENQMAPPPQQDPDNGVPPESGNEGQAGNVPGMEPQGDNGLPEPPSPSPQEDEAPENGEGAKEDLQSQAGSLAASLRQYNSETSEPDVATNKYVAGMILSAAIEKLSGKDREDVVKKAKAGRGPEENLEENPEENPEDSEN